MNGVAKLPQCGYAAGQAVCNAVLEVMGYGSYAGPYRDVDLFFRAEEGHEPEEIISQTSSWASALVGLRARMRGREWSCRLQSQKEAPRALGRSMLRELMSSNQRARTWMKRWQQ